MSGDEETSVRSSASALFWAEGLRLLSGKVVPAVGAPLGVALEMGNHTVSAVATAGAAAAFPIFLAPVAGVLAQGSRLRYALSNALVGLMAGLLDPPKSSDHATPSVRATAFVARKGSKKGERVMGPFLRVTSADPRTVLVWGSGKPGTFDTKVAFRKHDPCVGEAWGKPEEEVYRNLNSILDVKKTDGSAFGPEEDNARYDTWKAQFKADVKDWSSYMQKVRCLWAFCVWDGDDKEPLAVISVDSTERNAFDHGSPLFGSNLRQATAATVVGTVHAGLERRRGFWTVLKKLRTTTTGKIETIRESSTASSPRQPESPRGSLRTRRSL